MKTNNNSHFPFSTGILRSSQASKALKIAAVSMRKKYTAYISAILLLMLTPSLCFAQANAHMLSGVNAQTGTSYTILAADQIKLLTFNNPAPVAVTLPAATTPNFGAGTLFAVRNLGVGLVTITVTSGFIDGASTFSIGPGQGADIYSDGANYVTQKGTGANLSGMVFNQVPIATNSTTVTSSKPIQGVLDANILGAGTISGVTQPLCTDANGGATTVGCPAGGGASPAAPNFQAQVYNSGNLASTPCLNVSAPSSTSALANIGCDSSHIGPNPVVDIRAYGARPCDYRFTPCATGDTATISLGTPTTATVNNGADFKIGDGFVIYGAGPTSMTVAPTITGVSQVITYAGTGTGFTTPSATGASTRCYKVVARNFNGAQSPASTETCITNALAAEGVTQINNSSLTRSGQTVTLVTTSAHPFLVGCTGPNGCGEVFVGGSVTDGSMRGWYVVQSAPNSTTITYQTQDSTALGGSASATGGYIITYPCVHISWGSVANAWEYDIYEGASNAEALIDVSEPQGTNTNLTYDDYGSSFLSGVTAQLPPYLSNTPPAAAIAENLFGTITNIVTNTLTLSVSASTAVTSATIRLDAGQAIKAAATAITNVGATNHAGSLYIPALNNGTFFVYMVNAPLDLHSMNFTVDQAGPLYLNEPLQLGFPGSNGFTWYGDRTPQYGGNFGSAGLPNSVIYVDKARPGLYFQSSNGLRIQGVNFEPNAACTNGLHEVFAEGGNRSFWINDTFEGCGGTNESASILLELRGNQASIYATDITIDGGGFNPGTGGGATFDAGSHTPVFWCHMCGLSTWGNLYFANRFVQYDLGNIAQSTINMVGPVHANGGQMPFITTTMGSVGAAAAFQINLGETQQMHLLMDTLAHPCVAGFGLAGPTISGPCFPSGVPDVTGQPTFRRNGNYNTFSPNTDYWNGGSVDGGGFDSTRLYNYHLASGTSFFVNQPAPPPPTCTVSAGGTLAIGIYNFKIEPVWQDTLQGNASLDSATCTTTTGNQTITINWTIPAGTPRGMNLYYRIGGPGNGYASSNTFSYPFLTNVTSFVFSAPPSFNAHFLTFEPRSGPTVVNTNGIYTPGLNLAGIGIAAPLSTGTMLTNLSQGTFFDNFNRANGAIGANYITLATIPTISGNQAVSGTTPSTGYDAVFTGYPLGAFPGNQFAEVTVTGDVAATSQYRLRLNSNSTGSIGYLCQYQNGSLNNTVIYKGNGAGYTALATGTFALADNDIIRCEALNNTGGTSGTTIVSLKRNGVAELTATDSTSPLAQGFPGFQMTPGTAVTLSVDDFNTGNLNITQAAVDAEQSWPQAQHFQGAITVGNPVPSAGSLGIGIYSSDLAPSSSVCTNSVSKLVTTGCAGGSITGMVAGQVPIAASASTISSSKPLQGTDANILSSGTVLAGAGNSLCTDTGSGATTSGCPTLSGLTTGQVPIAGSATTVTSSKALQGTDTNVLSSGTVTGTGATLCTDANGGATTTGCTGGSISGLVAGQVAIAGTTTTITSSKPIAGTDANILSAGTVSSSANNLLCTDANGGATTSNCSVYNTQSAASTGNIAATNMVASAPANTMYLYIWTISLTTIGTGCSSSTTVVLNAIFTDPSAAGSITEQLGQITIAAGGNGTVGFVAQGVDNIYAKSGTAVQYSTSGYTPGTGCTINPTYQITQRLQPMT